MASSINDEEKITVVCKDWGKKSAKTNWASKPVCFTPASFSLFSLV
jgi:hypothetical protein